MYRRWLDTERTKEEELQKNILDPLNCLSATIPSITHLCFGGEDAHKPIIVRVNSFLFLNSIKHFNSSLSFYRALPFSP